MIPQVILAIENDTDRAFAENMYLNYRRLMLSEIQKVLHDPWEAEDVMQTVVEKLIDKLRLLQTLNRNHLVNYIITACRNSAISVLRERSRRTVYSFDDEFDTDTIYRGYEQTTVEEQILLRLDEEAAFRAWKKLPDEIRDVLAAKYILGQSDEEIAAALGIKKGSVRMVLTRARRVFREQIAGESDHI